MSAPDFVHPNLAKYVCHLKKAYVNLNKHLVLVFIDLVAFS